VWVEAYLDNRLYDIKKEVMVRCKVLYTSPLKRIKYESYSIGHSGIEGFLKGREFICGDTVVKETYLRDFGLREVRINYGEHFIHIIFKKNGTPYSVFSTQHKSSNPIKVEEAVKIYSRLLVNFSLE
jgi:hypothetical protein